MGKLLSNYKKIIIDSIIDSINTGNNNFYAFASNPIAYTGNTPSVTSDDYSAQFTPSWQIEFGKKLSNTDVVPVVRKNIWTSNTIYDMYDNTKDMTDTNYYVVVTPTVPGGFYNIYKCLYNNGGVASTQKPDQLQLGSFTTSDGYIWRYLTSIPNVLYNEFNLQNYVPIVANSYVSSQALYYAGVEVCPVVNTGSNYNAYTNGTIQTVPNTTVLQINISNGVFSNTYFNNSAIYIYNEAESTGQLRVVNTFITSAGQHLVYLNNPVNTENIILNETKFIISPQVLFESDAIVQPKAISVINSVTNSISSIQIIEPGLGVSRCSASIVTNFDIGGNGAVIYAICPPPGGHGYDSVSEVQVQGIGIKFSFIESEGNTIPYNSIKYNKIGIINNPGSMGANNIKGATYTSNTFSALLQSTISPAISFTTGETIVGNSSGAIGTVAYSNGSNLWLTGDKSFANAEHIVAANGISAQININTLGQIYTKDLEPLYIENISNITRSNTESESFNLIIKI